MESDILIVAISTLETAETSPCLSTLATLLLQMLIGGLLGDIDGLTDVDLLKHIDGHLIGHLE